MTPPFTGFFMNIVGLGKVHKEIERQKREAAKGGKSGPSDRNRKIGQIDQHSKTWSPSRPTRDNKQINNGPPTPSQEIMQNRDGQPPFPRVHCKDLSRETLAEYDLAWHWDNNDKDYVIIEKHLTRHELNELLQHTVWLRERKESDLALREPKNEVEQMRNRVRESMEWNDAERESERRHERGTERASTRSARNYDGRHAHVSQPGVHIHVNQTQNNQPQTPQKASAAKSIPKSPSPSDDNSQSSTAASMHSRLTRPWPSHGDEYMEWPHQSSRQTHRPRSHSKASQAPADLHATKSRRARESNEIRPTHPMARQSSGPDEGAPSTRRASRQWGHIPAPSEHVHSALPPDSESLAREARLEQAAENARRYPSQYTRGSREPRRERSPYSAQESELKRAYTYAPGSRLENTHGTGRYRGDTRRFRDV